MRTCGDGHAHAYSASEQRLLVTQERRTCRSVHQTHGLITPTNIVVPFPPQGFTRILTCVDVYTRWPYAEVLSGTTSETMAATFTALMVSLLRLSLHRFHRAKTPSSVQLVHDTHWNAGNMAYLTTAYHPSANGIMECLHRQLNGAITANADRVRSPS